MARFWKNNIETPTSKGGSVRGMRQDNCLGGGGGGGAAALIKEGQGNGIVWGENKVGVVGGKGMGPTKKGEPHKKPPQPNQNQRPYNGRKKKPSFGERKGFQ